MKTQQIIASIAIRHNGEWDAIYESIKNKETGERLETSDKYITILDENYPQGLKNTYKPPFILFYKGDIGLLQQNSTGIASIDSKIDKNVIKLIYDKQLTYICDSNDIYGLELAKKGCKVIMVLNNSLDTLDENIAETILNNGGLILTEKPNESLDKSNVRESETIISGLESRLVVISIKNNSKETRLMMSALQLGQSVFVIPLSISKKGFYNNDLIEQGAEILHRKEQLQ